METDYIDLFFNGNHGLTIGNTYTKDLLIHIAQEAGMNLNNLYSFTYNRWNRGTTIGNLKQLMFEWILIEGESHFKFLGPFFPYNGNTHYYNNDNSPNNLIGRWDNGVFTFKAPPICTHKQLELARTMYNND